MKAKLLSETDAKVLSNLKAELEAALKNYSNRMTEFDQMAEAIATKYGIKDDSFFHYEVSNGILISGR